MNPLTCLCSSLIPIVLFSSFFGIHRKQKNPLEISSPNQASVVCNLNINRIIVGDCEYGSRTGNQSKVVVAVFLAWSEPLIGEKIQVKLNGQSKLFDPFMKGCPPYVQFILDPDGGIYQVEAAFTSGNCVANPQIIQLPFPCDPPVCTGGQSIGGKVFKDFNGNGMQEASETGFPGVEVRLYDDSKQQVAVTTTKTSGMWAVNGLNPGTKVRVEFQVPTGLFDANPGIENKTRTQRAVVGDCNVNLGIYQLQSFIDPNPWMVTTCFAKGDATKRQYPAFNEPVLVANRYNTSEGGPRTGPDGNYYLASAGEIGSVWGLCFQKETRLLFSGAFLKRNASLGPSGLGAIYVTDLNNFLPNPPFTAGYRYYGNTSLLVNLDNFGIKTGDELSLQRSLPQSPYDGSHDSVAFDKIGKWGLGDLDVNDRGDTLFAVNLNNRSLVSIAIGNPLNLPITPDRVKETPIPDPGCSTSGDWRPWGIKYKDGVLYVGGVCSAESTNNPDDLRAVVYAYSNDTFVEVISFDLNYTKGFLNANYCSTFQPWNRDFYKYFIGGDVVCGPVPVLSDIEFDSEGNMIVSLGDRYGYQTGGREYGTNTRDGVRYISFAGGDNLKLFKLKNDFLLEQNGTSGFFTTPGANNNQGVCGGEFYFQDGFYSHQESSLGALAAHPSYNTIVATLMDPAQIWSNGWSQLDNSNGTKKVNYNVFTGENGTFGKAAGLGDIELLIGSSTPKGIGVSIGNFIWHDNDEDGLQDPGETPMSNVPVLLFDLKDSLLQQTTSDAQGLYVFKNLDPLTEYTLQIGADSNYINNDLFINNVPVAITTFRTRINFGNTENDSDASKSFPVSPVFTGKIAMPYTTGKDGENDFSLDFGLIRCDLKIPDTTRISICPTDSIRVGSKWFSKLNLTGRVRLPKPDGVGCDSIVLVSLDFHPESHFTLDTTICRGQTIYIENQLFDENHTSGLITLRGANHLGCDSSVDVHVHVLPYSQFNLKQSICPDDTIKVGTQLFHAANTTGSVLLQGANQFGCDSLVQVDLNVLPVSRYNLNTTICLGTSFTLGGQTFDERNSSGTIILKNANQYNCDSLIYVTVHFFPLADSSYKPSICPQEKILVGNKVFDQKNPSGTVILPSVSANGCDSIVYVNLNVLPITQKNLDTTICVGTSFTIHNQTFDENRKSGMITLQNANHFGCDSLIQVSVRVLPLTNSKIDTSICPGGKVVLENRIFDESNRTGTLILSSANHFGCDSLIYVSLQIRPITDSKLDTSVCPGGQIIMGSQVFNESNRQGVVMLPGANQFGCDSLVHLFLRIRQAFDIEDTIRNCVQYTWPPTGKTYTASGHYKIDLRTHEGCDSIHQLELTIDPEYHFGETLCVINKFLWPISGELYEQSGIYSYNHRTAAGCDSIENLVLLIQGSGEVYVPNAFSPNGDGINDRLTVYSNEDVKMLDYFRIFNRWGELLFEQRNIPPNDPQYGWTGIFKGQPANPAVFVYHVGWTDKLGGKHQQSGNSTLIR